MSLFKTIHPDAIMPERKTKGSVGYDLYYVSKEWNESKSKLTFDTGVALGEVPEGYFAAVFPRSSIHNTDLRLANAIGVIDPDFEGTIKLVFDCPLSAAMIVSPGNARVFSEDAAIGQILFLPVLLNDVVVPTEERGDQGFGSTDKKRVKK